jgi:pimeloyl-ACP methyl ester carboxylesterase
MAAGSRWSLVLAAVAAALIAAPAAARAGGWRTCGDGFGADCTRVPVPLDRSGSLPGTIRLRVARIPGPPQASTLVYLSGGPGSGGLDELENILWSVSSLTTAYRVVTFDQRGTGRSGLLRCPEIERDPRLRSTTAAAACANRLGAARSHYTTADSVEDLEAVRRALGVERITLLGISYGTELALAYARAHPEHVDRMALDSVVDPDDGDPFGLSGFRAMGPTLHALCPAACAGVSADPAADLARLVVRLRRAPMTDTVVDVFGRTRTRTLTPVAIADLLFDADYHPGLRAGVPGAVNAALAGDAAPLLRLAAAGEGLASLPAPAEFSSARYAAICEETPLPWEAATPMADRLTEARRRATALGADAFRPFDFDTATADEIELCLHWPGARSQPPVTAGPYPGVPTLLLQGGEDLRTPPEVSARVAARLPRAQRVIVPGVGHSTLTADSSGCAASVLLRFLAGDPVGADCPRVPTRVPAVAVPPRSLQAVPGASRVSRTTAAIGLTLDDVRFALSPAFFNRAGGGLRGGTYRDSGRFGLLLAGYEAIEGVRLSGRWHGRRLVLRIGGRSAARGRVTVTPAGAYRGVLAGTRVAGRLAHHPPRPVSRGGIARARAVAAAAPGLAGRDRAGAGCGGTVVGRPGAANRHHIPVFPHCGS